MDNVNVKITEKKRSLFPLVGVVYFDQKKNSLPSFYKHDFL